MACEPWRDALSAIADGEDPGVERALLEAHLRRCPDCRAVASGAAAPTPIPTAVPGSGDLTAAVRREAARLDRDRHPAPLRWLLVVLAAQIIALSVPALLFGEGGSATHDVRHTGAFATAYGVGLLLVAHRPARARTILTVGQVLVAALVLSAAIDIVDGTVSLTAELLHLPEVLSLVVLWVLSDLQVGTGRGGRWWHAIVPPPPAGAGR